MAIEFTEQNNNLNTFKFGYKTYGILIFFLIFFFKSTGGSRRLDSPLHIPDGTHVYD
jgi:hypothetical protein